LPTTGNGPDERRGERPWPGTAGPLDRWTASTIAYETLTNARCRSTPRSRGRALCRLHPVPVLAACFTVVTVFAAVSALERPLQPIGTLAFLAMAAALGASSGAVFGLVALAAPPGKVGAVTGIVGAAGGLGGFAPPLVMGLVYGWTGNYRRGLWLLSATALIAAVYTARGMRTVGRAVSPT
jgi:NNP family nitrate/nitrite transporter-like MFS transporter